MVAVVLYLRPIIPRESVEYIGEHTNHIWYKSFLLGHIRKKVLGWCIKQTKKQLDASAFDYTTTFSCRLWMFVKDNDTKRNMWLCIKDNDSKGNMWLCI